jgi:DNA repair protein RecO (recombination protein O)
MSEREEVLLEQGFVLHHRPYRNTSQLLDCLTPTYGRVGLVAQGSRGGRSGGRRALLQPFAPLALSWVRRGELGRLVHVEATAASFELGGEPLLAGFYVNELVLRLLARSDPNAEVFSCYSECLQGLASGVGVARALRLFELGFLRALGYGVDLEGDARTGEPLRSDYTYIFEPESGPVRAAAGSAAPAYRGKDLISLRERSLEDPESLRTARVLLGRILDTYLGERPLKSRSVFKDIFDRGFNR